MSIAPATSASSQASAQVSSGQAAGADRAKQQAALAKLLRTYQNDLNNGQKASSLRSLAKQITDAAKALGQNVQLPTASASSSSGTSTTAGKVGVTA